MCPSLNTWRAMKIEESTVQMHMCPHKIRTGWSTWPSVITRLTSPRPCVIYMLWEQIAKCDRPQMVLFGRCKVGGVVVRGYHIIQTHPKSNWLSKKNIVVLLTLGIIKLPYAFKMRQDYLSTSYLDQKYLPSERSETREIWIHPSNMCWDNPVSSLRHMV